MQQPNAGIMPEQDQVYTVLADLKRVAREYAIAVTESNCQTVRQMFTSLLNDTLYAQEQVYQLMKQQGWYQLGASAPKTEVTKQIQSGQQTQQKTGQFVQQKLGSAQPIHAGPMYSGTMAQYQQAMPYTNQTSGQSQH